MKSFLFCVLFSMMAGFVFGQAPTPTPPVAITIATPTSIVPTVPVAEAAAPPVWAEALIVQLQALPVLGPYVSKALVWLGVLGAITTAFVAFLLTSINTIAAASNLAGLGGIAASILAFKEGKTMYWLKYFSLFNAQKPK